MEPHFRKIDQAAYDRTAFTNAMATGLPALRQALSNARAALTDGDPARIVHTAIRNSELIINGLVLNVRHRSKEVAKSAGKASVQKRAAKSEATHKGEERRWDELRAKHGRYARGIHLGELLKKGIVISERQHRNRYPA